MAAQSGAVRLSGLWQKIGDLPRCPYNGALLQVVACVGPVVGSRWIGAYQEPRQRSAGKRRAGTRPQRAGAGDRASAITARSAALLRDQPWSRIRGVIGRPPLLGRLAETRLFRSLRLLGPVGKIAAVGGLLECRGLLGGWASQPWPARSVVPTLHRQLASRAY